MASIPLRLTAIPIESIVNTGRKPIDTTKDTATPSNWQPDLVAVSVSLRKIALIDITRPSDVYAGQLQEGHGRKMSSYAPLVLALGHYTGAGWQVTVLPWVVGIRGFVLESTIVDALRFLEISQRQWQEALNITVISSIEAFRELHKARWAHCNTKRHNKSVSLEQKEDYEARPYAMERKRRLN